MGEDWQSDFSCDGLANITSIPSIVKTTLSLLASLSLSDQSTSSPLMSRV